MCATKIIFGSPDGILVGWFEADAKPAFENHNNIPVENWTQYLPENSDHIRPLWNKAINRMPILGDFSETTLENRPDNFTPDGRSIFGESPETKNYYVAVGMNGNSLQGNIFQPTYLYIRSHLLVRIDSVFKNDVCFKMQVPEVLGRNWQSGLFTARQRKN